MTVLAGDVCRSTIAGGDIHCLQNYDDTNSPPLLVAFATVVGGTSHAYIYLDIDLDGEF